MARLDALDVSPDATPEEAEAALLAGCRAGNSSAIRALYDQNVRDVMRIARRLGLSAADAEDVAQEVFTVAFREIQKAQPGALHAWLFRMVSNRVNDRFRRKRVRDTFARLFGPTEEQRSEQDPERDLMRRDAEDRVSAILSRMGKKKREVFVLFEIEGLTGDEIAARVGCPVDTVWTRLHHARHEFARVGRSLEVLEAAKSVGGLR